MVGLEYSGIKNESNFLYIGLIFLMSWVSVLIKREAYRWSMAIFRHILLIEVSLNPKIPFEN